MSLLEIEEKILELKEKLEEKHRLERRLQHATDEYNQSNERIHQLKERLDKEEKDVKRLESISLTSMWYSLIGSKREKLMKEQEEVDQALYEYKRLDQTLNPLREEMKSLRENINTLSRIEIEYEQALLRKEQHLMVEDNPIKEELTQLIGQIAFNNQQIKELNEAIEAGSVLLQGMQEAIRSLVSAKGWGTFDLLGGGFLADMAKHSHLSDAEACFESLEYQANRFNRELKDLDLKIQLNLDISSSMKFLDFAFDGLIMDMTVQSRINRSLNQVNNEYQNIINLIHQLENKRKELQVDNQNVNQKKNRLLNA